MGYNVHNVLKEVIAYYTRKYFKINFEYDLKLL